MLPLLELVIWCVHCFEWELSEGQVPLDKPKEVVGLIQKWLKKQAL